MTIEILNPVQQKSKFTEFFFLTICFGVQWKKRKQINETLGACETLWFHTIIGKIKVTPGSDGIIVYSDHYCFRNIITQTDKFYNFSLQKDFPHTLG